MTGKLPIADAHQHFWDTRLGRHPWLGVEPPPAFRYGDTRPLRRPYLPSDYFDPNAAIKISGICVPGQPWTAALNREVVLAAIEIFGVERAMFASNFPVDGLCATFDAIYRGFKQIAEEFSVSERRSLFHDNACRIYAME